MPVRHEDLSAEANLKKKFTCVALELLLSLNLSWILIWLNRERERPIIFPSVEQSPRLLHIYWQTGLTEPPAVLEQVVWSLVLGIFIFALFRMLSLIPATGALLRSVGGALALAAFPLFYLTLQRPPLWHLSLVVALWAELASALIFGVLYYIDRLHLPRSAWVLVLAVHFSIWSWVSSNYLNIFREARFYGFWALGTWISTAFCFGFPMLGFLASLTWGRYVRVVGSQGVHQLRTAT